LPHSHPRHRALGQKELDVFWMTRGLPVLLEFGLLVYCLIDCVQSPEERVRNLRKGWWILLIIVVPLAGSLAWLFAGRPRPAAHVGQRRANGGLRRSQPPVVGPDDDPEFLERLAWMNRQNTRRPPDGTTPGTGTPQGAGSGPAGPGRGTGTPDGTSPGNEHGIPGEGAADEPEGR
jgi:hypothetical protein